MPNPPGDLAGRIFDVFVFLLCIWMVVDTPRSLRLLFLDLQAEFEPPKLWFLRFGAGAVALYLGSHLFLPAVLGRL